MQIVNTPSLPVLANASLPAHLAAAIGRPSSVMAAALTGLSTGSALRLVANQGRFRIKDGSTETVLPDLYLDVVIVGALPGVTKSFYVTAYKPGDEKENKQPDCSSLLGDVPDSNVPNKQSTNCAACPQNQWGSKISPSGKEIKACSDYRRIALVSTDDPETVYQANIPPASIKAWGKYIKELSMRGVDVTMVVTRLSLQEHEWVFNFAGFTNAETFEATRPLLDSSTVNEVLGTLGRTSAPALAAPASAPALAAPTPVQVAPAPAPAPAPVQVAPAPATEAEAPRGFGKKGRAATAAQVAAPAAAPAATVVTASAGGLDALKAELGALIGGAADL